MLRVQSPDGIRLCACVQLFFAPGGNKDMKTNSILRRILPLILLLMLWLSGCSPNARERSAQRLPEGWEEHSLVHDGSARWYRIYLPDPLPENPSLVLILHGGTLSMRSIFSPLADNSNSWLRLAEEQGIVLLVPNGTNPETGDSYGDDQVWNDLRPVGASGQSQVDDVGFILRLLDLVATQVPVDPDQTFVTGASNGGMMTYRLLIEAPERFAAGAAYIANLPDLDHPLPEPSTRVPILIANGTADPLMPYEGGIVAKDRGLVISTRETVDWWVEMNGGEVDGKQSRTLPDLNPDDHCRIREDIYPAGEGGAEVRLYSMEGGGHTLPSLDRPGLFARLVSPLLGPVCRDADGVLLAWDFFSEISAANAPR